MTVGRLCKLHLISLVQERIVDGNDANFSLGLTVILVDIGPSDRIREEEKSDLAGLSVVLDEVSHFIYQVPYVTYLQEGGQSF